MPHAAIKSEDQKQAEADVETFRRGLGPFVSAAENSRMPMVFTDAKDPYNPIIFTNDSLLSLTGYSRDELLGRSLDFLMPTGPDAMSAQQSERAFRDADEGSMDIRCRRKDGSLFWASFYITAVQDEAGHVVQFFASFMDLTRHKGEEERLRFLLDELNHRTQNTLATVQAIALQTLRGEVSDAVLDTFEGRILALSKAHSLLGRENWAAVGLHEVLSIILEPFGLHDARVPRFRIEGPDLCLKSKAALTLAMVFHELATNAVKYGALSAGDAGRIDIIWERTPDPGGECLTFEWREHGGPPVAPPSRKGFGSRLIKGGLAQDLGGEVALTYEPDGLSCRVTVPLSRVSG